MSIEVALPPPHDVAACGTCTYVAERDFIVVTSKQREAATIGLGKMLKSLAGLYDLEDSIVPLGSFSLPRWPGHAMFWLFQCLNCGRMVVDYVHGHSPYMACDGCEARRRLKGERFRAA